MKPTNHYEIAKKILKQAGYSDSTKTSYLRQIQLFLDKLEVSPTRITGKEFQEYIDGLEFSSESQQNTVISALKFFYTRVLKRTYGKVEFIRPRRTKSLPRVIDQDIIKAQLAKITNIKHKAIISLTYSAGLRVSEVINLKMKDIDSDGMRIFIKNAKGKKDRIVPLSAYILKLLREYYIRHRPVDYLFNGPVKGKRYSATSCRNIMKSKITDKFRFHDLRHSTATHLYENGTDIKKIQILLGHKHVSTTEIYTHVSQQALQNIRLPI